jgi:argininosuccinate lyase
MHANLTVSEEFNTTVQRKAAEEIDAKDAEVELLKEAMKAKWDQQEATTLAALAAVDKIQLELSAAQAQVAAKVEFHTKIEASLREDIARLEKKLHLQVSRYCILDVVCTRRFVCIVCGHSHILMLF